MLNETLDWLKQLYEEKLKELGDKVINELKSDGYKDIIEEVRIDNLQTLVIKFKENIIPDEKQDVVGVLAYGGTFQAKLEDNSTELKKVPPNDTVKCFLEVYE
jgi:hypothetical protein